MSAAGAGESQPEALGPARGHSPAADPFGRAGRWLAGRIRRARRLLGAPNTERATAPAADLPDAPDPAFHFTEVRPTPVTRERIASLLEAQGYRVGRNDQDDVVGMWDGNTVRFSLIGDREEILQVTIEWQRQVPESDWRAMLQVCNDWNRDRSWPKAYVDKNPDAVSVFGETALDLEHGATDPQLRDYLDTALATSVAWCDTLSRSLPPRAEA